MCNFNWQTVSTSSKLLNWIELYFLVFIVLVLCVGIHVLSENRCCHLLKVFAPVTWKGKCIGFITKMRSVYSTVVVNYACNYSLLMVDAHACDCFWGNMEDFVFTVGKTLCFPTNYFHWSLQILINTNCTYVHIWLCCKVYINIHI